MDQLIRYAEPIGAPIRLLPKRINPCCTHPFYYRFITNTGSTDPHNWGLLHCAYCRSTLKVLEHPRISQRKQYHRRLIDTALPYSTPTEKEFLESFVPGSDDEQLLPIYLNCIRRIKLV
jgi:hypothetical protein